MTEEEKAVEYADNTVGQRPHTAREWLEVKNHFIAGYDACLEESTKNYNSIIADYDKQIEELKKQLKTSQDYNKALGEDYQKLEQDCVKLVAQIEKMKCCDNCKHRFDCGSRGYVCDKWKMFDEE